MGQQRGEPIAIIGSACRFAGGIASPSQLWEVLRAPRDLCREIPGDRFNAASFYHPDGSYHGRTNVKHAYMLEGELGTFDAEFFGIKPVEAQAIDPQQRFLLEVAYEALENAGLPLDRLKGSDTGTFVGAMSYDFGAMVLRDLSDLPVYAATGTGASLLSNRLSYFFDWHGPSVTLDTACSSSLVAVHLAVQALRAGESRTVLACGSNLILGPENFIIESKLKMLSPSGRSRMWDQNADGYARGEGVGVLVLKTLRNALEDGDAIECVIRETAVNQDGASDHAGITMPHAPSQEALIRATYTRAGLDLRNPKDGPQLFEAHGTGTPAGDPIEAEAIYKAISQHREIRGDITSPLYVGSIKTVLGHTEGTAGVAALMKTSQALKHGVVPPNLLFEKVSSRVAPFYKAVEIPTVAKPWPQLNEGDGVRRASVNSFGFGGANAHAILESYESASMVGPRDSTVPTFAPYVFSALSEKSLRASLSAYSSFLNGSGSEVSTRDLSWTLHQRRSILPRRAAFPASSAQDLSANITRRLAESTTCVKALSAQKTGRILGIFTGQGAQYPRMGAELVEHSAAAMEIIERLEKSLKHLPDPPDWSLKEELLAEQTCSRVHQAAVAQPLCTAVQILLVDLLRLAGIEFHHVVGHSSGEIGAAYAAGYLTAEDAVIIAYYRGFHLKHASSPNGRNIDGAMLAVSGSVEDLEELCQDPVFSGRISIAAFNSPTSFTLSGDDDAISEMQILLDDEKKFNRRLRVDMAYHSDHMIPCSDPYLTSLRQSGVRSQRPPSPGTWFSSVHGCAVDSTTDLSGHYWVENLTKPVLFSKALENALKMADDSYDLILEVGAHPALKGPCAQTIEHLIQRQTPYTGVLSRGLSAITASSAGLGFIWEHLESGRVNLNRYEQALSGSQVQPRLVRDLPTYCWNHENSYWHESRISRRLRGRNRPAQCLLGDTTPDSAAHHLVWKNLLRVSELDWIAGHRVQGQMVFPAAGYLAAAVEAARVVAHDADKTIRLFELRNFSVHQAMVFEQEDSGIELVTQLFHITRQVNGKHIQAKIEYSAAMCGSDDLILMASGELDIHLGPASPTLLGTRSSELPHMVDVEPERFYRALEELGYEFSGRFKSLSELRRRHFKSSCQVESQQQEDFLIHPADLDAVLQSCILAYSYPYDGQLRSLHVPTTMQRIRINPAAVPLIKDKRLETNIFDLDAAVSRMVNGSRGISGDVTMYSNTSSHGVIQIQGARFLPAEVSGEHDKRMFSREHWIKISVDGSAIAQSIPLTEEHRNMHLTLERTAAFYLRKFDMDVAHDDPIRSQSPTSHYLNYARHITSIVQAGRHKVASPGWLHDTLEDIIEASSAFPGAVDFELMHLVGTQMPRVFRGETTMLEEFRAGESVGILDRYYAEAFGLGESARWVGRVVAQIVDRYPRMNILEIGAGTGSATKAIFREIGQRFCSYTYTDISAAFFEKAMQLFPGQQDRMLFKTLDVEKDPLEQGYVEGAYDLVVAFFVIHATSDLEQALRNTRKLLRPGGFLVVGEGQEGQNSVASSGFIFGTLPGWWLGAGKDGRDLSPHVSPEGWARLLQATGFAKPETSVPNSWRDLLNVYHFVAQAVDDQIQFLREPLAPSVWSVPPIEQLIIIGGQTRRSSHLAKGLQFLLEKDFAVEFYMANSLADLDYGLTFDTNTTILSLLEVDEPIFEDITPVSFEAIKSMFGSGKRLFWVTSGRMSTNPYSNMTVGFGRVAANESPDLRLQQLDIEDPLNTSAETVAEIFLRFYASEFTDDGLLWPLEPETRIDSKGDQAVSRLRPVSELNDRYNSIERTIIHERNICDSPVVLRDSPNGFKIENLSKWDTLLSDVPSDAVNQLDLHISHATVHAIRTPLGHRFLALGSRSDDSSLFLALMPSLVSRLQIPASLAVSIQVTKDSAHILLAMVAAHLAVSAVLDSLYNGQTVLIHNAEEAIAQALVAQAASRDIKVVFTSDPGTQGNVVAPLSLRLSEFPIQQELDDLTPRNFDVFVNFGDTGAASDIIISSLSAHCRIEDRTRLFSFSGSHIHLSSSECLGETLSRALQFAQGDLPCGNSDPPSAMNYLSLGLVEIANGALPESPLAIVELKRDVLVPVQASRLDVRPMFRSMGSTYWIAGMTGALGISLCDWMIRNGAKSIAITSRRPEISPDWIAAHKSKGIAVLVISCDMTKESEVIAAHETIRNSLPPVVGVINGAMVLRDVSIRNMSFEQLTQVLEPKVSGSIFLDRLFYNTDLEFFVLVSSINCIIGSWGQANYAAANMFMCALAAQRRERGLRAATVNVGAIIGAGYMERESRRSLDAIVQKLHMMRLSEEDWHQAMGEAIDASRLQSKVGPELTTGLSDVAFDAGNTPSWFTNPRYSEFIVYPKPGSGDTNTFTAPASLQTLLQDCSTYEDLYTVVREAFANQLRNILQITMPSDDLLASRSGEIGIDSLVSVDIRSWFFKNMQVSTPVLMIMGNSTMESLVRYAVDNMPTDAYSGLAVLDDSQATEATTTSSAASTMLDSPLSMPSVGAQASDHSESPATIRRDHEIADLIDWESEANPPKDWDSIQISTISPISSPPETIVVTGVTGLLGHHLLEHLLKSTSAKTIHCLAVRGLADRLRKRELRLDPRVKYYQGSLSEPLLGLSSDEARFIFASADAVIHNGADTSHMKSYSSLKTSNVGSTRILAGLCLPRRVPLHYISSAGVGIYFNRDVFPEVSLSTSPGPSYPPADGVFGYGCSKWVCERLLEQTHMQFGLPVSIYRPSTIIRKGEDISTPGAQFDWVNSLIYYVRKLEAAPRIEGNPGTLDLVHVETCCAGVLNGVLKMQDKGPGLVHVSLVGDKLIPIQHINEVDLETGKRYDVLPLSLWLERAMGSGLQPSVGMLIEEMGAPGGTKYPRLLKSKD